MADLKPWIRNVRDFPKPGIMFRDITPLLSDPEAFRSAIQMMADPFRDQGITAIAAAEARGFIFAAPLALGAERRFHSGPQAGETSFRHAVLPLRARIREGHAGDPYRRREGGGQGPPRR